MILNTGIVSCFKLAAPLLRGDLKINTPIGKHLSICVI